MSFTGSGTSTVIVMLNGQTYRKYVIDYSSGQTDVSSYDFIPTEPPTTKPPTEPTTVTEEETDPPTELETDTVQEAE